MCINPTIKSIRATRHNKAAWHIQKPFPSHPSRCDTIVMNVGAHIGAPPHNTIPTWLYRAHVPQLHVNALLDSNTTSLSLTPPLHIKPPTIIPKTLTYNSWNSPLPRPQPHHQRQRKQLKYQTFVDTLENAKGYVSGFWGGIHKAIITILFEQCYIPLVAIHACIQQTHLIAIKYLSLLMLKNNWCKTTNRLSTHQNYRMQNVQQNPKSEYYNVMPKPTQLAHIKRYTLMLITPTLEIHNNGKQNL